MAEERDRSDGEFPMKLAVCTKHGEWWQLNLLSPVAPCPHPGCQATTLIYSRVGVYTPAPDPLEARDA